MSNEERKPPGIQIPTFLVGRVVVSEIDVCMQKGVTHLLIHTAQSGIVATRLEANNPHVAKVFKQSEGRRIDIAIAGIWKFGVEGPLCNYVSVYSAVPKDLVEGFMNAETAKA